MENDKIHALLAQTLRTLTTVEELIDFVIELEGAVDLQQFSEGLALTALDVLTRSEKRAVRVVAGDAYSMLYDKIVEA